MICKLDTGGSHCLDERVSGPNVSIYGLYCKEHLSLSSLEKGAVIEEGIIRTLCLGTDGFVQGHRWLGPAEGAPSF